MDYVVPFFLTWMSMKTMGQSWSEIPGTTTTLEIFDGFDVSSRSRVFWPLVCFLTIRVSPLLFRMFRNFSCSLGERQVLRIFDFHPGKLKSPSMML